MHSRLCMYLYVCQHKMELTHTWRERDTPFLLQSSIALIERIWNLSFFLLFPFVLPLLLFSYICIVWLRFALPFFYIVCRSIYSFPRYFSFAASDLPVAITISNRYLFWNIHIYALTQSNKNIQCIRERYEWSVVWSVLDSYAWWWWETTHVHSCIFYTISIDSSPSNCLLHFAKNRQTWLLVYIAMAHMAFKVHRKLSSAHYYYWVCCYHYVSKYSA